MTELKEQLDTRWENTPTLPELKADFEAAKPAHDAQISKINDWLEALNPNQPKTNVNTDNPFTKSTSATHTTEDTGTYSFSVAEGTSEYDGLNVYGVSLPAATVSFDSSGGTLAVRIKVYINHYGYAEVNTQSLLFTLYREGTSLS